jgi:hypothetical protein
VCILGGAPFASAQVNVWTYHNDNQRTGANLNEARLTLANVKVDSFGLLFSCPVDGQIFAQPLYLSNVALPNGTTRNLVFVATENDTVYALDADASECIQIWSRDFRDPNNGVTAVPSSETGCADITPNLGITATPVIDVDTGTLYVVTKTKEVGDGIGHYVQRLRALSITTGLDVAPPVNLGDTTFIAGVYTNVTSISVCGTGQGSEPAPEGECPATNGRVVKLNALRSHERTALLLTGGVVYLSWASHCDVSPWHGWFMGYDALTLQQVSGAMFNTSPNGQKGGIWQGGAAPSVDAEGNIYLTTGNGTFGPDETSFSYGDSVLKLSVSPEGVLSVADSFTPYQDLVHRGGDRDLSSGGVLLLPRQDGAHPNVLVTAGKENVIYLINRDDLGGYYRCGFQCDDVLAKLPDMSLGETNAVPAYLNTGTEQFVFYLPGKYRTNFDHLKRFKVIADDPMPSVTLVAEADPPTEFDFKGGIPSLSAHLTDAGVADAIIWVIQEGTLNQPEGTAQGVLHAYDALATPMTELYNSAQAPNGRDGMGNGLKFSLPTIANGKVYAGTATRLDVFGCLNPDCS